MELSELKPKTKEDMTRHLTSEKDSVCACCGVEPFAVAWTDFHGEVRCTNCGLAYQTKSFSGVFDWTQQFGLEPENIVYPYVADFERLPLYREYWDEARHKVPDGRYMGAHPDSETNGKFFEWLYAHRVALRPEWEDYYRWESIEMAYGPIPF